MAGGFTFVKCRTVVLRGVSGLVMAPVSPAINRTGGSVGKFYNRRRFVRCQENTGGNFLLGFVRYWFGVFLVFTSP